MSEIGKQIKKYRTAKGITQEQLGDMVGVTTQAVSKWERGGVPDAELLPSLSRALGVSMDTLFGLEEANEALALVKKLNGMSQEDAFRHAFMLCWAMMIGAHPLSADASDEYTNMVIDDMEHQNTPQHFSMICVDSGIMGARTQKGFRHFFLMPEPEGGLRSYLTDIEGMRQVFATLADPHKLQILLYLYTRINTPIAASLISKNTGIPVQEVDRHMEELCRIGFAKRDPIATADGLMYSYMFIQESTVVALLCLADEIRCGGDPYMVWEVKRQRPLMY